MIQDHLAALQRICMMPNYVLFATMTNVIASLSHVDTVQLAMTVLRGICAERAPSCMFSFEIKFSEILTLCSCCRIMEEDSKMCPICRRLIHKIRRLFSP